MYYRQPLEDPVAPTEMPAVTQIYYRQPIEEPLPVATATHSKREKKIIDIIDPRTGINVITDHHDSSTAESKPLTNEVCSFVVTIKPLILVFLLAELLVMQCYLLNTEYLRPVIFAKVTK